MVSQPKRTTGTFFGVSILLSGLLSFIFIVGNIEAQNEAIEKILADVKVKFDKIVTAKQFLIPNRDRTVAASSMISFQKSDPGQTCQEACQAYEQDSCVFAIRRMVASTEYGRARSLPEENFYHPIKCNETGYDRLHAEGIQATTILIDCTCTKRSLQPMSSFSRHITVDGTVMAKDFVVKSSRGGQNALATLVLRNIEKQETCDQICPHYNRKCVQAIRAEGGFDFCTNKQAYNGSDLYCFCGGTSPY